MKTGVVGGSGTCGSSWISGASRLSASAESCRPKARLHTRKRTQVLPLLGYDTIQTTVLMKACPGTLFPDCGSMRAYRTALIAASAVGEAPAVAKDHVPAATPGPHTPADP